MEPLDHIESVSVDIYRITVEKSKKLFSSGKNLRNDWTDSEGFENTWRGNHGFAMLGRNAEELIKLASDDWSDFQSLRLGLAHMVLAGDQIPDCARDWLSKYLKDEIKTPRKPSGRPQRRGLQLLIHIAVSNGVQRGLTATRNELTEPKLSACDAVAEALRQLRLPYASFDTVKNIWEEVNRHFAQPGNSGIPPT